MPEGTNNTPTGNGKSDGTAAGRAGPYRDGDIVILEHPLMMEECVVALIDGTPSKSFANVRYWKRVAACWTDEPKRRKLNDMRGIVPPEADVGRLSERLRSASAELVASQRRAKESYRRTVDRLCAKAEGASA